MTHKAKNLSILDCDQNIEFLKEWRNQQFKKMHYAIEIHLGGKTFKDHNKSNITLRYTFYGIDQQLGFAYTSTSSFAMYSVCSEDIYLSSGERYAWFGIGEDGNCYAGLRNKKGEDRIIKIY